VLVRKLTTIPSADIRMSYLYPWDGVVHTPFGSAWGVVAPGQTSRHHMHHEAETFFIARGRGLVTSNGEAREVDSETVIYFPPFTTHTLTNLSDTEDLLFLTVWWEDPALHRSRLGVGDGAAATVPETSAIPAAPRSRQRTLVITAPLTPNGDLHLGHLSGPYLGADIYTRYLRLRHVEANHATGADDYQSYVVFNADRTGSTPAQVAAHHAEEVRASFRAAEIAYDQFLRAEESQHYAKVMTNLVRRLVEAGHAEVQEAPCPYCEHCERFLFEAYVSGTCPHCGEGTGGSMCEGCGRPNEGFDLIDPVCNRCRRPPVLRPLPRLFFPMARHAEALREHLARASMPTRLRALCERILADGLPTIALSRIADGGWGIPVPVPGLEDQVLTTWFELGPAMMVQAELLGESHGWRAEDRDILSGDLRVVNFFGFDNSFFYALLVPALFLAAWPDRLPPATFVSNEFYRLDGLKFSTSRNHAIWVGEYLSRTPPDLVRFYLCLTRPEREQTSFTESEFRETVRRELGLWQTWLHQLGGRLRRSFDGIAQEPGFWTPEQRDFYRELQVTVEEVAQAYEPETFSLRRAARLLCEMVRRAYDFGNGEVHWETVERRRNELRTSLALELAAARALSLLAAPILPRFSTELWRGLGNETSLQENGWEEVPAWVPPNTRIDLDREYFAFPG
jgi:methionyl-tRNA synthetase